jgi:hypothetical protein
MRKIFTGILFFAFFSLIQLRAQDKPGSKTAVAEQKQIQLPASNGFNKAEITYQLIPGNNNTWGYNILVDKKVMIKQPTPPGLPGNNGFATKKGAEDVARLVIAKMKKGEMPPSVTIDEMKKIKAI